MMKNTRGYTLLEMIVSVGLFSVVMLIATSAYLTLIGMDRQTRATSDLMTNLSFAIDSMVRAIRTGTDYCSGVCSSDTFSFVDSEGRTVVYTLDGGVITREVNNGDAIPITDSRVKMEDGDLRFYVWGEDLGASDGQPRVTFTIKGTVQPDSNADPIEFVIQSSATQRAIDI